MLERETVASPRQDVVDLVEAGERLVSGLPKPREERMAALLLIGLALLLSPDPSQEEPIEDQHRGAVRSLDEFALAL